MAHWQVGCERRNAPDVRLRLCSIFCVVPFAAPDDQLHFGGQAFRMGIVELASLLPRSIRKFPLGDSTRTPYARDTIVVCDAREFFRHPIPVQGHHYRGSGSCRYLLLCQWNAVMATCGPNPMPVTDSRGEATIQSDRPMVRRLQLSRCNFGKFIFFSLHPTSAASRIYHFLSPGR